MADVNAAIKYVIGWEDSTLSGAITTDSGGRTRFGIAERWHPELTASLFYGSMGSEAALKIAEGIYDISYAQPLCLEQITSQEIANKLLSLAVNVGVKTASLWLQDAVMVAGDGRIGPITLISLSRSNVQEVLARLTEAAEQYYNTLVEKDPSQKKYLKGWLRRATA